jgi:acyl transferase domain-containing protein
MVTTTPRRWPNGYQGLPARMGTLSSLDRFDNTYFNVSGKQSHMMDAQLRLLLEVSAEAVLDAGLNLLAVGHIKHQL